MRKSKRDYFRKLINQFTSRNVSNGTSINKIEFNSEEIKDTCETAEAFNTHFTEIGETLANKIPKTDTDATSYLKPTNSTFSFKTIVLIKLKIFLEKFDRRNRITISNAHIQQVTPYGYFSK